MKDQDDLSPGAVATLGCLGMLVMFGIQIGSLALTVYVIAKVLQWTGFL